MKRLLFAFILVFMLSSCGSNEEPHLVYDESDFVFEINQSNIDLSAFFDSENTLIFNLHDVEFDEVGEYTMTVTDVETEEDYIIPIVIVDTISPMIHVPVDFEKHYDVGAELDTSTISVTDNSEKNLTFTSNIYEIDMESAGTKSLILIAVDYSGNLKLVTQEIIVRNVVYPVIDINTFTITDQSLTVEFSEIDAAGYKIESFYRIVKGYDVCQQNELTDTFTFEVTELLPNTTYEITLDYIYQVPGEEEETLSKSVFITTLE